MSTKARSNRAPRRPISSSISPWSTMPGMVDQGEMDELMGLRGARFDLAFVDMMTRHHQGAIQMANTELKDGSLPEVKHLAQQIISAQQREVSQLAAWKQSWA